MPDDQNQIPDLLTTDTASVDLRFQHIAPGEYNFVVHDVVKTTGGEDNSLTLIKISLRLQDEDAKDVYGDPIRAGYPIRTQICVTPTGKLTSEMITESLTSFRRAALGSAGVGGAFWPLEQYKGKVVRALVVTAPKRVNKKTGIEVEEHPEIKRFVVPKDCQAGGR